MGYRVRDWEKFKHFKDRNAPWVKLNKDLLNNRDWFDLPADTAKTLVMLWLVASEDPEREGNLPDLGELAFRLRFQEAELRKHLDRLRKWLDQNDTGMDVLSTNVVQHDDSVSSLEPLMSVASEPVVETPKKATPRKKKKYSKASYSKEFRAFWALYPKKAGKTNAYAKYTQITKTVSSDVILAGLRDQLKHTSFTEDPQHFTFPETWLNQRRWEKKAPDSK